MITDNTAKWQKKKLTNFASNEALPVGHIYQSLSKNVPVGSLPLLGGEYDRSLYADLWSWANENGLVVSEAEWQASASAAGGSCAKFSDGNGSTTFRVPALKCWVKGANGVEEVGSYLEAGLPNIEGSYAPLIADNAVLRTLEAEGAFFTNRKWGYNIIGLSLGGGGEPYPAGVAFEASRFNSIYGNSDTVQPPSIVAMYCIVAYGTVTNVGNIDIADALQEFRDRVTPIEKGGTGATSKLEALQNLGFGTQIYEPVDLNNLNSTNRIYCCNQNSIAERCTNTPMDKAFVLEILPLNATSPGDIFIQRFTEYTTGKTYIRRYYGYEDIWTSWKEVAFTDSALCDNGKSLVEDGYQKFSNGLCIQWGVTDNQTVTFPIPFTQVFSVVAVGTAGGQDENTSVNDWYSTGFKWGYWKTKGYCLWIAIGKV